MSKILLQAMDIAHRFDTELFHDVHFTLLEGESIAIVGRSGSGKSTLLHICSSFIKPQKGSIELLGETLYAMPDRYIESVRRYNIGIIFQFHYLFKGMSAMENIEVATLLANEVLDQKLLERLEISDVMGQKVSELSGGQQQRVSIARVLSKKPKLIFADEPTGNLDSETAALVMDVLHEYVSQYGAGLIVVTHDMQIAAQCHKTYQLSQKKLNIVK